MATQQVRDGWYFTYLTMTLKQDSWTLVEVRMYIMFCLYIINILQVFNLLTESIPL